MIDTKIAGGALILTNEAGTTIRVPLAECPRLVASALEALGVTGSRYQQGWKAGRIVGLEDGILEGYRQCEREFEMIAEQRRAQARREVLALLEDAEVVQAA